MYFLITYDWFGQHELNQRPYPRLESAKNPQLLPKIIVWYYRKKLTQKSTQIGV